MDFNFKQYFRDTSNEVSFFMPKEEEVLLDDEDFDSLLMSKEYKPYYVPDKDELLKYQDQFYFEKTRQYNFFLNYVKKNFFDDEKKAVLFCEYIQGQLQFGSNIQSVLNSFEEKIIHFKDIAQVNEVMQMVSDLSNNIRIWENNGHTRGEIYEKYGKTKMIPLPEQKLDSDKSNIIDMNKRKKIGRNDLCPCGSGKKYKKCCLGKSVHLS